jgi:hypothetical protein
MSQVALVDTARISHVLQGVLTKYASITAVLITDTNGSVFASAYRGEDSSVKIMRTQATTITSAYALSSDELLSFEADALKRLFVVTSIADRLILGVVGALPERSVRPLTNGNVHNEEEEHEEDVSDDEGGEVEDDSEARADSRRIREQLELVCSELAIVLRPELANLRWPDDL